MSMYLNNPDLVCPFSVSTDGQEQLHSTLLDAARQIIPDPWSHFSSHEVEITPLTGGITNVLFKLRNLQSDDESRTIIIRLFGEGTSLFIDRNKENIVFSGLSRLGMGFPTFYGLFENGRIEGFLDARALTPMELHDPRIYPRVATALGKLHSLGPVMHAVDKEPVIFSKMHRFFELALEVSFASAEKQTLFLSLRLADMKALLNQMEQQMLAKSDASSLALSQLISPPSNASSAATSLLLTEASATALALQNVFCHNDMLSGNILLGNAIALDAAAGEGSALLGVTLIDFEYAGYNPRAFDLANHFCEFAGFDADFANLFPDAAKRSAYIMHYLDASADECSKDKDTGTGMGNYAKVLGAWQAARRGAVDCDADRTRCELFVAAFDGVVCQFTLFSHLFWGSWAAVQASMSAIDFDFLGYSKLRFGGFSLHKQQFNL